MTIVPTTYGAGGSGSGGGPFKTTQTFSWSGPLAATAGSVGYFPPFFMAVESGTTVKLVAARYVLRAGSANVTAQHNGSYIPVLGTVSVSTTATTDTLSTSVSVADGDSFGLVVASESGADGLTFTFVFLVTP